MEIARTYSEIEDQISLALMAISRDSDYNKAYIEGVHAALEWVIGGSDTLPMDSPCVSEKPYSVAGYSR